MAQAVPLIVAGIGAAVSVQGSRQQAQAASDAGKAQQAANEFNAEIARRAAVEQERKAIQESRLHREQTRRERGRNLAQIGKSGVLLEGSPLLLLEENARDAELDNFLILREGQIQKNKLLAQSSIDTFQGNIAREAGSQTSRAILLSGKAKAASDISSIASSTNFGNLKTTKKIKGNPKAPRHPNKAGGQQLF